MFRYSLFFVADAVLLKTRGRLDPGRRNRIDSSNALSSLRGHGGGDLLASIVVFRVPLPLCMVIAIVSDAPLAAGLVTSIVGGLFVGLLAPERPN